MLITQPRSKKNQNGPRTSLMGPGGVVGGKNRVQKISQDCPLKEQILHFPLQKFKFFRSENRQRMSKFSIGNGSQKYFIKI